MNDEDEDEELEYCECGRKLHEPLTCDEIDALEQADSEMGSGPY